MFDNRRLVLWVCESVIKSVWWDPAAHHLKASKQARLVERKVCFTLDAGKWEGRVTAIFPKVASSGQELL